MDSTQRVKKARRFRPIVVALMVVVAWSAAWLFVTARSRETVRRIESLNGMVTSTSSIGRFRYGELDRVYLLGPQTDDRELQVLRGVPALRILILTNTRVTEDGLAELARYPNLNYLSIANIDHTKLIGPAGERLQTRPLVTGRGLERLKDLPNLESIQLIGSPTTDEDLQSLRHLKNLTMLDLKDTKVTPSGVAELKKALPKCRITLR